MQASTSGSAVSIRVASFGILGRSSIGHPSPWPTGRLRVVLGKRGGGEGRDDELDAAQAAPISHRRRQ